MMSVPIQAYIQTPRTTIIHQSSFMNPNEKAFVNMEARFPALKGYIDRENSMLNVHLFVESSKETVTKMKKREKNKVETLQQNTQFLIKELLSKDDMIDSVMEWMALESITKIKKQ